ncbi:class I SAM-dependent methyltransferase (plasmid) [Phyllobacterium sp. A18/5-2]|uniref:class I SAM-dependent methyltransferase n=1 Tax=Phyllobacterium sp. A18/5-2 TaxID=2978392 RepID=UPI0021C71328|nr:class I SAM-dependent methyltransferase [Phyllobacterium sp. A18/5-2]UXN66708.1 class I SAM-dependent methyltransferase [Phyllobacterium sp. A18/5-2]
MSRLDSFIFRMTAQREILNHLTGKLDGLDGPILELGLGNGRTFDHLRECFPDRRIIVFDRAVGAHKTSTPEPENMVVGEIRETAQQYIGVNAALAHVDIGTGYDEKDAITLTWLPQLMAGLVAPNGFAVSGLELQHPHLEPLPMPPGVEKGRYFLYRRV